MNIEFVHPEYLWFLLAVIPCFVALKFFENIRVSRLKLVSNVYDSFNLKQGRLYITPLAILTLLIFCLARPYMGAETIELPGLSRDVFVLQDISKSMLADDIKPNRLEFSKRKLFDLIKQASAQKVKSRIGLILFSGESYLYCPLTEDYGVLEHFIKSISTDLITTQGTALKEALTTAINSIKDVKAKDPSVILVTDGEDSSLNVSTLAGLANGASIRIDILAVGTKEGSPIKLNSGAFVKDQIGNIVISKMDESNLKQLASSTNGIFKIASYSDNDIQEILNSNSSINQSAKSNFTVYNEKAHYLLFAILALIFILIFSGKEAAVFALIMCLHFNNQAFAEEPKAKTAPQNILTLNEAYHAYENKDYKTAEKSFEYYYNKYPDDYKIAQSYASSLYQNEKFPQAKEIFNKIKENSKAAKQKFEAQFNSGNTDFKLKDYKNAIKNYNEALKTKPQDSNTLNNLELAKLELEELKKQPTPTPTPTASPQASKSPDENKDEEKKDQDSKDQDSADQESKEEDSKKDEQKQDQKEEEKKEEDSKEKEQDKEESSENKEEKEGKEDQKESEPKEEQSDKQDSEQQPQEMSEEELKEAEAKAWLESLPQSPLLLRRKTSKTTNKNKQQW